MILLKLLHAATISTAAIIALGIILVIPTFIEPTKPNNALRIMLSFSIADSSNASAWCSGLSSVLKANAVAATVFFTGKTAEQHPEAVKAFPANVDIGSQTYSYVNLTLISNYDAQLEEVSKGKQAVDFAGKLSSRIFKAPHGSTDQNIYSLLSESGISADFSYEKQYNLFLNGQFVKFEATSYRGSDHTADFYLSLPRTGKLTILNFDDTCSLLSIAELVERLKGGGVEFVNASELAGFTLTERTRL